ncbi:MAG: hypothetical protein IJ125_08795, partial [Atopobiaceae bacterium]|nr:hypothetical protein [Atopobiaceae bacterium]
MAAAPSPSKPPLYKRKWFIVLAVLLMLGLIGSCSDKKDKPETPIEESSQIEQSEEPSKSEPEVLVISLTPTTEFLEYSKKSTDALRLVECSNSEAKITTDDKLDLSHVGRQKVTYKLSISDQEVEQSIEFVIRDTKAPKIKLKEEKVTINQGESYNPKKAIAYVTDEIDGDLNLVEEEPDSKGKNAGQEQFFDK